MIAPTETMVLPAGLLLLPVAELPETVRKQAEAEPEDYALTRPNSRTLSRIVDASTAELLKEFRQPVTVVDAVISYSRKHRRDPQATLEEAYPMLERLASGRLLVSSASEEASEISQSLELSSSFLGWEVMRCLQSLDDTEVYQLQDAQGQFAALKLGRRGASDQARHMFERESALLKHLNGEDAPRLLDHGETPSGQPYLIMAWVDGADSTTVCIQLRVGDITRARRELLTLSIAILRAYEYLHGRNIIHSDVHPRNVLVGAAGQVTLIDFGFARISGKESIFRSAPRAGIAHFYEPEYARAILNKRAVPASSAAGEQYALAALLYFLVTGKHYLDFAMERDEMMRQIAEQPPLPFTSRGVLAWPGMENALARALAKQASERYKNVSAFADAVADLANAETIKEPEPLGQAQFSHAEQMLDSVFARTGLSGELWSNGMMEAPHVSFTFGSVGIAYALYRVACNRDDSKLLSLADLWAQRSLREAGRDDAFYSEKIDITPTIVGRTSPFHTASGVFTTQFLIARAQGDIVTQQTALANFLAAVQAFSCESLDVTLGRSGSLLVAAILLDAVKESKYVDATALRSFGKEAISNIWAELDTFGHMLECHKIAYSGAAHGWAGILYSTLSWCKVSGDTLPANLLERLEQLSRLAEPLRRGFRWRWSMRHSPLVAPERAYMSGWCNGSAGFVYLWTLAHQMLKESSFAHLAEGAAFDCAESESPVGNLCCGFGGQAYALLNMHKHSGDSHWLHRAQALAEKAARSFMAMPTDGEFQDIALQRDSLYKGELGVALLTEELKRPAAATMPFFEVES